MWITMLEKVFIQLHGSTGLWRLYGRVRDNGDVVQVLVASKLDDPARELPENMHGLGVALVNTTVQSEYVPDMSVVINPDFLIETTRPLVLARQGGNWHYSELEVIKTTD